MERNVLARVLPVLVAAVALAGCTVTVQPAGPRTGPAGHGRNGAGGDGAGGGGHERLARIADEGQVTYSVELARCHARAGGRLPDPRCTPGSVDPAVTQAGIDSTICRSGYTERIRPPESQTGKAKYQVSYPAYGIPDGTTSELDHLVSLELGGSNDITNLWPEAGSVPNPKDAVENALHRAVCAHKVTLAAAQRAIATDWMTALARLGLAGN